MIIYYVRKTVGSGLCLLECWKEEESTQWMKGNISRLVYLLGVFCGLLTQWLGAVLQWYQHCSQLLQQTLLWCCCSQRFNGTFGMTASMFCSFNNRSANKDFRWHINNLHLLQSSCLVSAVLQWAQLLQAPAAVCSQLLSPVLSSNWVRRGRGGELHLLLSNSGPSHHII